MSHQQHCYCAKCQGRLVSERTERTHRNGPAFRQLEAASRKSGPQKRPKVVDASSPGFQPPLGSNSQQLQPLNASHSDVVALGGRFTEVEAVEHSVSISFLLTT